ncbi:MAG: hypothetical protein HRU15_11060, partial [Planctomycetes bacterium]|nr:hypothetical protein [Planctomycetota bacterium]
MNRTHTSANDESIVIVGIGGIFPGASNLDEFWRLIVSGMSAAQEVPAERWALNPQRACKDG